MEAEGEGVLEETSTPQLLTKGTLYRLPDNPKVTWLLRCCPTLPPPFPYRSIGPSPPPPHPL